MAKDTSLDLEVLGQEIEENMNEFDQENNMSIVDEDAVLRNTKKIDDIVGHIDYQTVMSNDEYSDLASVMDSVNFTNDDGEELDESAEEQLWGVVIDSAKQQATMLRAGDVNFFMKKDEEKREVLRNDIKDFVSISVVRGVSGSAMRLPNNKEVNSNSPDFAKYVKEESEKARQVLENWLNAGERAKIKQDFVLNEAVDTSAEMKSYADSWKQKGFKRVSEAFKARKDDFDAKMKRFWGKAYEVRKAAVEHIKNNKWRLIADTAATATVALTATSGVALPVVAGYALYTAAGAWAWPLIEKKSKAIREAKKAGLETKEWRGLKGVKKAYSEIKADKKAYKTYKNRAYTGTAFGIAGAGVVAGMGVVSNWAVDKVGYLTAKVASSAIRSTGSVTSQILNYRDAKKDLKADNSPENKEKLKQAKWGLGIGAAIAMAGNLYGFNHLLESNSADSNGFLGKVKSWFKGKDEVANPDNSVNGGTDSNTSSSSSADTKQSGTNQSDETPRRTGESGNSQNNAEVVNNAEVSAPKNYSEDMGISERHWNEMHKKLTGIYENHSEIFGMENVSSEEAWDKMYQNLENARTANPNMFGNMTNEEFLYKYMKLIETTERVKVGPDGYMVTRLDKDGLPMYNDPQIQNVMRAITATLNCGDEFKIKSTDLSKVLGYVDENSGRYIGPGAEVGVTGNRYVGGRVECGDEYQNAWARASRKVAKKVVEAPKPVEVEPQPEVVQPKPQAVEDIVVNKVPTPKAPEISEEVINVKPNTIVINEGSTDGSLDVNSDKVKGRSRNFRIPTSEGR